MFANTLTNFLKSVNPFFIIRHIWHWITNEKCSQQPPMTDESKFGKSPTQNLETERKHESIFDDDEDDLFGPPPLSKVSKTAPTSKQKVSSIFDDSDSEDELFGSVPSQLKRNIFDDDEDEIFGNPTVAKKAEVVNIEKKEDSKPVPVLQEKEPEKKQFQSSIFDDSDEEYDDLFSRPKSSIFDNEDVPVNSSVTLPKTLAANNTTVRQEPDSTMAAETEVPADLGVNVTDGALISKTAPPKSLNIRTSPGAASDGAPKRPVSNKIANLMGKMGNLKILSPTDTPPVLRKEKNEEKERDSDDAASSSLPSISPLNSEEHSQQNHSPLLKRENSEENAESAISFDDPVRSETLSSVASKSRARILTKRRPQSRHARQNALRHSGIDFDVADAPRITDPDRENSENTISERLMVPSAKSDKSDDRSSANKNTLLSPSTDEEDLFDVPPDLPEDSVPEDSLFDKAPLLSLDESVRNKDDEEEEEEVRKVREEKEELFTEKEENEPVTEHKSDPSKQIIDPLRDKNRDPLKDPSQLFAFVTRTASPEQSKILFNDDDSLFCSKSLQNSKDSENAAQLSSKSTNSETSAGIFDDDYNSDLFSNPTNRPIPERKVSLFTDEEDDNDELFGAITKKPEKNKEISFTSKKSSLIFDENDDDTGALFETKREDSEHKKETASSNLKDIFGDQLSGEEDLFSSGKSAKVSENVFKDDDSSDIFSNKKIKDLKKTAEKISEDPLSLLQVD